MGHGGCRGEARGLRAKSRLTQGPRLRQGIGAKARHSRDGGREGSQLKGQEHLAQDPVSTAFLTHTWCGSACWQSEWPQTEIFLRCIYYYILIKVAARRQTFLCAMAAQMFHKEVPNESEVKAQPACPHKCHPSVVWR